MTANGGPPFRADHVGSLLRSQAVLDARARRSKGEITAEALREIEDVEIEKVVAKQRDVHRDQDRVFHRSSVGNSSKEGSQAFTLWSWPSSDCSPISVKSPAPPASISMAARWAT